MKKQLSSTIITIGDFVHAYNRGNRKALIVRGESDKWRLLKIFRYINDKYSPPNLFRQIGQLVEEGKCRWFEWPKNWLSPSPLVKILSYCIMPNHFHLLLKEIIKGGISKFMARLSDAFTRYSNVKYDEAGRVFQGSFKRKVIETESILQYTDVYMQVFNPFELYPGGIKKAIEEFDKAFEFALNYPFSSLGESFKKRNLHIIERDVLKETFPSLEEYKAFAREALMFRNIREILGKAKIE